MKTVDDKTIILKEEFIKISDNPDVISLFVNLESFERLLFESMSQFRSVSGKHR